MARMWMWKRDEEQSSNGGLGEDSGESGQYNGYDEDGDYSWWWSPTGMAIRYTIIILIFASIVIFFLGGYYHAQRRIRKGLPPLPYHSWMVRRAYRQQPRYNPYYNYHQQDPYYRQYPQPPPQHGYAMHDGEPPLPPPPYTAPPPAYAPPVGASKAMADQSFPSAQAHRGENPGESSQVLPPLPPARQ